MSETPDTSQQEACENFQSVINNLTADFLSVAEGADVSAMAAAGMNVVLNGAMALKEHPGTPPEAAGEMVAAIRRMVDYIESTMNATTTPATH